MELPPRKASASIFPLSAMNEPKLIQATSPEDIDLACQLFREYATEIGLDLCFQGFEEELRTLPGKYSAPAGRLFLIIENGAAVACGALRPFQSDIAEMKRLYVRPAFRKHGHGRRLAERLVSDARVIGYRSIYLDTHSSMVAARSLYASLGFGEIDAYYQNPLPDVCYLRLDLTG
jgi:putative acetyltransferase